MNPSGFRSKARLTIMNRLLWSAGTIACVLATAPARADFFFHPFGYAFHRPLVEPEPDVSPRRIAAILGRSGFRLVGPLGHRGQQIVAAGVDARGMRQRFLIDPYEGRILESWPIGPRYAREAPPVAEPYGAPEAIAPASGEPRVIPGIGGEATRPAQPRAATPPRSRTAVRHSGETAAHSPAHPAPSQSTKVAPTPSRAPAPASAAPANAAGAETAPSAAAPQPSQPTTPPTPQQAAAPAPADTPAAPAPSAPAQTSTQQPGTDQSQPPAAGSPADAKPIGG